MAKKLLIFSSNYNYIKYAKVAIYAALTTGKWDGDIILFYLKDKEMNPYDLNWFKYLNIEIKEFDLKKRNNVGEEAKKLIYNLFKSDYKKWDYVVHLDIDVIINKSLKNIFNNCQTIMMVKDSEKSPKGWIKGRWGRFLNDEFSKMRIKEPKEIKKQLNCPAYASGTVCVNASFIEEDNKTYKNILKFEKKYRKIFHPRLGDQPILNICFSGKIQDLDFKYNRFHNQNPYGMNHNHTLKQAIIIQTPLNDRPWEKSFDKHSVFLRLKWLEQAKNSKNPKKLKQLKRYLQNPASSKRPEINRVYLIFKTILTHIKNKIL